jgi:alpha-1,6-mannosyltransferase
VPAAPAPRESSSSTPVRRRLRAAALSWPLLAANLGLLLVFDLAHHLGVTLALLGAAFLGLLFVAPRLEAASAPGGAILLGALLLRLPLLPLPPNLSDDALRYLWDGKVASAGFNPYALAPEAGKLTPLRDENWRSLSHKTVPTVYPPLSLAAFSIASRLPFPMAAWKLMASGADLAGCWLLVLLARKLGLPEARTAWYAWNPLVALEVAGMGHVDALGVAAVVGAVLLLAAPVRRGAAATLAAAAVLAKLVPLAAFPLWARRSGRPGAFLAAALGLVAVAALPVAAATGGVPPGLVTYGVSWEFDGPLFEPLWRLLQGIGAAPALARGLDHLKEMTGIWQGLNPIYPYLYPQFLAKVLLGALMIAAVVASLRERDPAAGTGRLFGRLLLCSATVYPWYLLWVLPFAALRRDMAWLVLSASILMSYLPQFAGVALWPWVYLGVWAPFGVMVVTGRLRPPGPSPPGPISLPLPPSLTGRGGD